jgi:NAD(P)-dependent dehydrogenase (short-subunit alcohol dehydrogenase family)
VDVAGKIALVTGAGYGIGRGIALQLASAGAQVIVNDVHDEHGRETVSLIESSGANAAFVHADVTLDQDIQGMVAFVDEEFGGLDILVNNAGPHGSAPYFPEGEPERWLPIVDGFLRAVMLTTYRGVEALRKRGGAIVSISSSAGAGFKPYDYAEYAAAKAGVMRMTASLGRLNDQMNVRVNCICPGWVATEAVREYLATATDEQKRAAGVPDPMLTPADIGDAVRQLVEDDSLFGRIMLYYEPGKCRLIPTDLDLFELSEEVPI